MIKLGIHFTLFSQYRPVWLAFYVTVKWMAYALSLLGVIKSYLKLYIHIFKPFNRWSNLWIIEVTRHLIRQLESIQVMEESADLSLVRYFRIKSKNTEAHVQLIKIPIVYLYNRRQHTRAAKLHVKYVFVIFGFSEYVCRFFLRTLQRWRFILHIIFLHALIWKYSEFISDINYAPS